MGLGSRGKKVCRRPLGRLDFSLRGQGWAWDVIWCWAPGRGTSRGRRIWQTCSGYPPAWSLMKNSFAFGQGLAIGKGSARPAGRFFAGISPTLASLRLTRPTTSGSYQLRHPQNFGTAGAHCGRLAPPPKRSGAGQLCQKKISGPHPRVPPGRTWLAGGATYGKT